MDYYLLADMTVQIGYELAVAGAETYRVEETMRRVIEAYGTEGQAFAIPNCVAVSFVTPNTKPLTIMKRVGYHGNDLERIEKLNALSRRICAEVRIRRRRSAGSKRRRPPSAATPCGYITSAISWRQRAFAASSAARCATGSGQG